MELSAPKTEKETTDMALQHCESSGIQVLFKRIVDRYMLRERAFGQIYAYVNPWYAAMDDEIEDARVRCVRQAAQKRAERRTPDRVARPEGPMVRP
jgi:hypothetical protein